MKAKILLILLLAALLTGCQEYYGEMTIPADVTLPKATEYVLDKPYEEAKTWLEKNGYTHVTPVPDKEIGKYVFERGSHDIQFVNEGAIAEEIIQLAVYDNIVESASAHRCVHNMIDAVKVYEAWSNYTWRHIFSNPLIWEANLAQYGENETSENLYLDFIDGTFEREEGVEYSPNRKEFEKQIRNNEDKIIGIAENYDRISKPKEISISLEYYKFVYVRFENRNQRSELVID